MVMLERMKLTDSQSSIDDADEKLKERPEVYVGSNKNPWFLHRKADKSLMKDPLFILEAMKMGLACLKVCRQQLKE